MRKIGDVVSLDPASIIIKNDRYRFEDIGDIDSLAKSIEVVGQNVPIIINESYELIAGERRTRACIKLGIEVKAIVRTDTGFNENVIEIVENLERKDFTWKEKALAVADLHKIFLSEKGEEWSGNKTAEEVGLSVGGVSNSLSLAKALKEAPEIFEGCTTHNAALKALKAYKIDELQAEIFLRKSSTNYSSKAQKHLYHGSCLDLVSQLPDHSIDCLISDPIYGVEISGSKKGTVGKIYEDSEGHYKELLSSLIQKLPRVLKKDSWVVMFCAIQHFGWLKNELEDVGIACDFHPALWNKTNYGGQANNPPIIFSRVYDVFVYGYLGSATLVKQGLSNVLSYPPVPPSKKIHQVEKPVELMEEIISRFCLPGFRVLDPFSGSGTTIIAALKRGCYPIGFELDETYYKSSINRISEFLKLKDSGNTDLEI